MVATYRRYIILGAALSFWRFSLCAN